MLKSSPPILHSGLRRVLQLVRHIPLSAHPVSDLTLTLDVRDLEPQRSLGRLDLEESRCMGWGWDCEMGARMYGKGQLRCASCATAEGVEDRGTACDRG